MNEQFEKILADLKEINQMNRKTIAILTDVRDELIGSL